MEQFPSEELNRFNGFHTSHGEQSSLLLEPTWHLRIELWNPCRQRHQEDRPVSATVTSESANPRSPLGREHSVTYPCDSETESGQDIVFGEGFPTASGRGRSAVWFPPRSCRRPSR